MQQSSLIQQDYLQFLLDSFRGELCEYGSDLPTERYEAMSWNDLADAETILPELEANGQLLIEQRLGYRPAEAMMQTQEPVLRRLIKQHQSGFIADEEFMLRADHCIKMVRSQDMQIPTYSINASVAEKRYATYLTIYGDRARRRLTHHLGYTPDLEHSLIVELWLRQILARERYALPEEKTPIDCKAVMLVQSREAYAEGGWDAVYALPLPNNTSVLKLKNNEVRTLH